MGQEILYCHQCGTRLVSDDFTRGRAHTLESRSYCSACIPKPISAPRDPELKTRYSTVAPPGLPMAMKLGLGAVAVLAVVAIVVVLRPPKPPPPAAPVLTTSAPPKPAPRPEEEAAALRRRIDADLRALNIRVDVPVGLEQFGSAIGMLQEARKIHVAPEWTGPIDQRIRTLRKEAENRYQESKDQAVQARTRGAVAEVDKIKQRVAQWAMPELVAALESDLAAVRIAPPIPVHGLRLIPASPDGGRVQRRHGVPADGGVEAIPFGPIRTVGFEGELFQVPSDGEVQVTFVTDTVQPVQIRIRIIGDKGQSVPFDWMIRNPAAGSPVQVKAPFRQFTESAVRGLPAGSIVKQIHVSGHDPKVPFRVTELLIVKRRD